MTMPPPESLRRRRAPLQQQREGAQLACAPCCECRHALRVSCTVGVGRASFMPAACMLCARALFAWHSPTPVVRFRRQQYAAIASLSSGPI